MFRLSPMLASPVSVAIGLVSGPSEKVSDGAFDEIRYVQQYGKERVREELV